jgi:uncharacterized protein YukE
MTTPQQFQVDLAQLRKHSGTVRDLGGQLSAVASGQPDGLGANALGTFVGFLAAGLQGAATKTTAAIAHASSVVDATSAKLGQAAESYRRADESHAARLGREDVQ